MYSAVRPPVGTRIEFWDAPLASAETYRLIDRIHDAGPGLAKRGVVINSITSEWAGPVTVRVRDLTPAALDLADQFGDHGSGTVVVEGGDEKFVTTNRDFDTSPFFAGAHIVGAGSPGNCSSGFTGRSSTTGARYMITAAHCVNTADPRFWTNSASSTTGGSFIGQATVVDPTHDIAYVRVASPSSTEPRTWGGAIYPKSDQFVKTVSDMRRPETGMRNVCTSGSFSGARCYGTVKGGGWQDNNTKWLWYADSDTDTQIIAGGDSGGPVFVPHGSTVTAIGMISGSYEIYRVSCTPGDATRCYRRVYFADAYTEAYVNHDIDLTR